MDTSTARRSAGTRCRRRRRVRSRSPRRNSKPRSPPSTALSKRIPPVSTRTCGACWRTLGFVPAHSKVWSGARWICAKRPLLFARRTRSPTRHSPCQSPRLSSTFSPAGRRARRLPRQATAREPVVLPVAKRASALQALPGVTGDRHGARGEAPPMAPLPSAAVSRRLRVVDRSDRRELHRPVPPYRLEGARHDAQLQPRRGHRSLAHDRRRAG